MKKNFIIAAIAMLLVSISSFAQSNANFDEMYSRMASRLAKNMKLDDVATEQFTTLYAEYMKVRMAAAGEQTDRRERVDLENITDEQATEMIEKSFATQELQLTIDREYYKKFIRIITPAQAAQIFVRRTGMMGGQRMNGNRGGFNGPRGGDFGGGNFGGPGNDF
jgi:acetolactate synthase small subunit